MKKKKIGLLMWDCESFAGDTLFLLMCAVKFTVLFYYITVKALAIVLNRSFEWGDIRVGRILTFSFQVSISFPSATREKRKAARLIFVKNKNWQVLESESMIAVRSIAA